MYWNIIIAVLLILSLSLPHLANVYKTQEYKERIHLWLKKNKLKTIEERYIPSPFHPINRFLSNLQCVYLVKVVDEKKKESEIYFCFGSPFIGGFSNKLEVRWKEETITCDLP